MPVAKVMQPHRQTELPQLAVPRLLRRRRPSGEPRRQHSTLPIRSLAGPENASTCTAPLLGQHNHELLSELGVSDKDIDALESQGVIGTAPAMHGATVG